MTPVETIEKGIRDGDLELIARGFAVLTGRTVPAGNVGVGPSPALAEALAWYADKANYSFATGVIPVMLDEGQRARAVTGVPAGTKSTSRNRSKAAKPAKKASRKSVAAEEAEDSGDGPESSPAQPAPVSPPASRPSGRSWDPPQGNKFKDNKTEARKDIKFTKLVCEKITPAERRPPVNDPEVRIDCDECGSPFTCLQSEVRHKRARSGDGDAAGGDVATENYCPKCLGGSGGGRK